MRLTGRQRAMLERLPLYESEERKSARMTLDALIRKGLAVRRGEDKDKVCITREGEWVLERRKQSRVACVPDYLCIAPLKKV